MTQEQREYAIYLYKNVTENKTHIGRELIKKFNLSLTEDSARKAVRRCIDKIDSAGLVEQCEEAGLPIDKVNHYWYKGEHFSIHVKDENIVSYDEVRDEIIESMRAHAPKYPTIVRSDVVDGHLLVMDPADVHIGKLASSFETGEEYNSNIAVKRVREGVQGVLDKTEGYNIDKILFIGGNDILHIDTPDRKTTKGTSQDTDKMWYENFLMAKNIYIDTLEKLMRIADVHFMYNPSNHDYTNGFFLADTITSWFHKCPHITFDVSIAHRKYYQYGDNLIGTTHGDGAKTPDLPLLMAQEAKEYWSDTKHRYIYTHHLHHKISKDIIGVTVESLRSPSGTDSWHHRKGYQHAPKAIEGFLHHPKHGQVARITHLF
jgi:hypothetical protein|tara:strand:- start:399 stop:1520 length:1122 start_codon:yes stop_codon:yes gene_type:complete